MTTRRRGLALAAGVLALLGIRRAHADDHDRSQFRAEVFLCEEAIRVLVACCPGGFDARAVTCDWATDETTSCGSYSSTTVRPSLDSDEAACILARASDCGSLADVCPRAQTATSYTSHYSHTDGDPTTYDTQSDDDHAPVCP